jgi:hypothetical protein
VSNLYWRFMAGLLLLGISLVGVALAESQGEPEPKTPAGTKVLQQPAAKAAPGPVPKRESKKAQLTADEVRYIDETRQIEAKGHVKVTYSDTVIEADYVLLDQETDAMLAKDNVRLTKDGATYYSEQVLYYFKTERGLINPVSTEITSKDDSDVKEPIKVTAEEAWLKDGNLLVNKSALTGCDREHPHYRFTAEKVEYYPDDRIVLRSVWYWEGRLRLFYFPVLTISLDPEGNGNDFEMPEIGYSDDKGWYLAWGYNYYFNKKNSARFYLDKLTQWGGNGFGGTHTYKPKSTVKFFQDYFFKENSNMGYPKDDYRVKYGYSNSTNSKLSYETTLTSYLNHNQYGYQEMENIYHYYLYGKTPWPYLKFYFHDTDSHTAEADVTSKRTYRQMKFYESWSYNFNKSLSLSTKANWSSTGYLDDEPVRQFIYSGTLTKNWTNSNLTLYYNNVQVLSGDYSSNNYLPKLTYTLSKFKLPLLNELSGVFKYTNLQKIDVDEDEDGKVSVEKESGERWSADVTKNNTLWKSKTDKIALNLTSLYMYRYFIFEDNTNDLGGFKETLSAKYKFTNHLSSSFGVAYTLRDESNNADHDDFFNESDNFLPGGSLTNSWTWSSPKLAATVSSGYSFYTNEPQTVYLNSTWKPNERNRVYLSTNYDWDKGIGSSYLRMQFNPKENWKLNVNLGYNPQTSYWTTKEFQAYIIQRLTANWRMELNATYDVFDDDFGVANMALVYNWHCRDVKFYYDHLEKEYWALISFKAFPKANFKLSSDPDDLYSWYTNYDFN